MKSRNGFVSNSSSSSFMIPLSALTAKQLVEIQDHGESDLPYAKEWAWNIEVTKHAVKGSTFMDNFDMHEFLELIGVDMEQVKFGY